MLSNGGEGNTYRKGACSVAFATAPFDDRPIQLSPIIMNHVQAVYNSSHALAQDFTLEIT